MYPENWGQYWTIVGLSVNEGGNFFRAVGVCHMVSKLQDDNTANIEKAKSLTADLSAAQMNWRPQPGKWSIAQNLAHLNFGYPGLDTIASSIAAARAKGIIGNGPFRYGWLSSWIMKSQEPPPKRKFKAAKVNTPSPDV